MTDAAQATIALVKGGSLLSLGARLTESEDRTAYAGLVSYFCSLPEGDEVLKVAELLGFLTLVGQCIPDALATALIELREQAKASELYHCKVDERLAALPSEIAEGIDAREIAEAMSGALRQQLVTAGLHETALLLKAATKTIKTLSAEIATSLKPATQEYASMAASLTAETAKLISVSSQIGEANKALRLQKGFWQAGFFVLLIVMACALCFKFI
jgi:hypothetical protein